MDITGYLFILLVVFIAVFSKIYLSRSGQTYNADLSAFEYKPTKEGSEGQVLKKTPSSLRLRSLNREKDQPTSKAGAATSGESQQPENPAKPQEKGEVEEPAKKEAVATKKVQEEAKEESEEKVETTKKEVKEEKEAATEEVEAEGEVEEEGEGDDGGEEEEEEDEDEDEEDEDEDEDEEEKDLREVVTNGSGPGKILVACASLQGKRPKNEDRSVIQVDEQAAVYGVFDGHDGYKASEYCAKFMARNILQQKSLPTSPAKAIINGFKKTDRKFLEKVEQGGSTAIVSVLRKGTLFVGNVGDSRCVASVSGKAVALSTDHKPDLPAEQERIKATAHELQQTVEIVDGKRVKMYRIDGTLAVSRAIGDIDFKDDPDKKPSEQAVSCIPDIQKVKVTKEHEFVVMACDGLWDVLSNQEVVDYVKDKVAAASSPDELVNVSRDLVSHAISKNSHDNVTALIIKF